VHVATPAVVLSANVHHLNAIRDLLLILVHAARPPALNKSTVRVRNEKNFVTHTHNKNVAKTNPSHLQLQASLFPILPSS